MPLILLVLLTFYLIKSSEFALIADNMLIISIILVIEFILAFTKFI